ncbi:hypothetical protein [Xanthomonas cerealis]|uniref:hypothetical protein n=1 Tax=Xanthomonas cerealis TaxID=3390025 RepID=UPI001F4607F3|nr:hypothetical protein [Xanthomonas translucens]
MRSIAARSHSSDSAARRRSSSMRSCAAQAGMSASQALRWIATMRSVSWLASLSSPVLSTSPRLVAM